MCEKMNKTSLIRFKIYFFFSHKSCTEEYNSIVLAERSVHRRFALLLRAGGPS